MRIAGAFTIASALLVPLTAGAQPGMYAAPPPSTTPTPAQPAVTAEPKAHLAVSLLAASPKGDWSPDDGQIGAETSPGFGLQLGIGIAPAISIFGGLRYVRVQFDESADPQLEELSLRHRELQLGMRFTTHVAPAAKLYLQADVHRATVSASFQGQSESVSGTGFGVGGGVIFMVDRKMGIGLGVNYSTTDIEPEGGGESFDNSWLVGDLSLHVGF